MWTGNTLVGVFIIAFGVWSILAPLESAAIAGGLVEVESSRKTIQHLEGGIIRKIFVRDGDEVTAGQVLIQLDDTRARNQLQALRLQYWDALAREARLIAERDELSEMEVSALMVGKDPGTERILAGQRKIFEARTEVLRSQVAVIEERIAQVRQEIVGLQAQEAAATKRAAIIRDEYASIKPLVDKGLQTRPRLLALEREIAEIDGRRGETVAYISRAEQAIAESRATMLKLRSDRQNEVAQSLRETQSQLSQLVERIESAADQLSRTEVKAPEQGTVTDLRIHTLGGVVSAGAPLMDLVPKAGRLIIRTQLKPDDIDVVRVGLPAEVHLAAYNQRRAPPLKGVVSHVSPDSLVDKRTGHHYYGVKIELEPQSAGSQHVQMMPGMPVYAFIRTGESTVAIYTLQPFLDAFHRAFRES
jgi:HlyD family secretion protein